MDEAPRLSRAMRDLAEGGGTEFVQSRSAVFTRSARYVRTSGTGHDCACFTYGPGEAQDFDAQHKVTRGTDNEMSSI